MLVFTTRTTLCLRPFLYVLANNLKEFKIYILHAANEEHSMLCFLEILFLFWSYFPHQMKFRELLGKEKKISVFHFLFLMIHIFFTSPLLPSDKIQQIKIIETALLLQSNIFTVTGIKLSFGISLQQWRLLYMPVSEKTASSASTPAGRT